MMSMFAEDHPELLADIVFGARACLYVDGLAGAHMLDCWQWTAVRCASQRR